jgi:hypothetical protein
MALLRIENFVNASLLSSAFAIIAPSDWNQTFFAFENQEWVVRLSRTIECSGEKQSGDTERSNLSTRNDGKI